MPRPSAQLPSASACIFLCIGAMLSAACTAAQCDLDDDPSGVILTACVVSGVSAEGLRENRQRVAGYEQAKVRETEELNRLAAMVLRLDREAEVWEELSIQLRREIDGLERATQLAWERIGTDKAKVYEIAQTVKEKYESVSSLKTSGWIRQEEIDALQILVRQKKALVMEMIR